MKVLVGIPCLQRGGTEMQTLCLVRALLQAGYAVQVFCYFEYDDEVAAEFEHAGCRVRLLHYARSIRKLSLIRRLAEVIRREKPDVVHVQYMAPGALPVIAAKLAGVKKVLALVHQPHTASHGWKAKVMLIAASVLCTHFMAVSCAAEQSWFGSSFVYTGTGSEKPPKHFTLFNAVDTMRIVSLQNSAAAASLKKKYRGGAAFVFGYIGRLHYEKGVDVLCEAFGRINRIMPETRLLIVGDGPEKMRLEERFSLNCWWKNVYFPGMQSWENSMSCLSAMDVMVVPSRFEGFGLTAVEAMAASRPVIASRTGGLLDIVQHGGSGLFFENENIGALASMMQVLMEPNYLRVLQQGAFERSKSFDVAAFNKKIAQLYLLLLS